MNIKLIIIALFSTLSTLCQNIEIVRLGREHKQAALDIMSQNMESFFVNYEEACAQTSKEDVDRRIKTLISDIYLEDRLKINRAAICDSRHVAGFVSFWKTTGFLTHTVPSEHVKIEWLGVANQFRRRGIGKALIKSVFDYTKDNWPTVEKVELDVPATNTAAIKFYESQGFTLSPEQDPLFNGRIYERYVHSGASCQCAIL